MFYRLLWMLQWTWRADPDLSRVTSGTGHAKVVGKQFYPHSSLLRILLILWCHITWGNTSAYLVGSLPSALHHYNGILGSTLIFCARSVWKTLWPWSPTTSVFPSTNRTRNRQNLHRIWLALHYLLELWTTLSSNLFIHSIDWHVFFQLRFP